MLLVSILASFWEPFGIHFQYFFGIDFWMPFWMPFFRFLIENGRQRATHPGGNHALFEPQNRSKNASATQLRFFIDFGSRFGHIFVVLAPKIEHLALFRLPFGPRWLPLGSLWLTFATLWLTFGALGLTFARLGIQFLNFGASLPKCKYLWLTSGSQKRFKNAPKTQPRFVIDF